MDLPLIAALLLVVTAFAFHYVSIALALVRTRRKPSPGTSVLASAGIGPPVSIVRPVCGVEPFEQLTLGSTFKLTYPDYEIIFCCGREDDPVVPIVRSLIAAHPERDARLLIGDDGRTANPKLNNVLKGWAAASHDLVVLADSNVLMPTDYIEQLMAAWQPDTGLVCSPPIGDRPQGFAAEVECAFLNTYQARWQLAADAIGMGFAQGKSMLWRRSDLEPLGGIAVLGQEAAEDAAATKVVRSRGLRVRLVDRPFAQALGPRTLSQVWSRQVRWARLRRATFALYFAPEVLTGSAVPGTAWLFAATSLEYDLPIALVTFGLLWFGAEALLNRLAGWHLTWWSPAAWITRDLALPVLWCAAWTGNGFTWRGNAMTVSMPRQANNRDGLAPTLAKLRFAFGGSADE